MRTKVLLALLACSLALIGCNQDAKKAPEATNEPTNEGEAPKPSLSDVPADLKHAAYEYYGLTNPKQVDMEIVVDGGARVLTGTQTVELVSVEDGNAVFRIERTGQLAQLGSMDVSVEKDGLYAKSASIGQITRSLELPADLAVGKEWTSELSLESSGGEMKQKSTMKAVRTETVKTKAGEFKDALRVEGTGTGTFNGQAMTMKMTGWYVKGEGPVRLETEMTKPDGSKTTQAIERT